MSNHQAIVLAEQYQLQKSVSELYAEVIRLVTSVYRYMMASRLKKTLKFGMYDMFLQVVQSI